MNLLLTLITPVTFPTFGTITCVTINVIGTDGRIKAGGIIAFINVWNRELKCLLSSYINIYILDVWLDESVSFF